MKDYTYEREVDTIMEQLFRESWMSNQDYLTIKNAIFQHIPKIQLIEDLKKREENGYSLQQQLYILKTIFQYEKTKSNRNS